VLAAAFDLTDLRVELSLMAVGLPLALHDRLASIFLVSALIHDLGKSSSHFQSMIQKERWPIAPS